MSASRFVKAATLRKGFSLLPQDGTGWLPAPDGIPASKLATPGTTSAVATPGFAGSVQTIVNVAMQLVQVVQATPYGTLLEQGSQASQPQVGDWTMWSLVRDHTNRVLYYTTAFNGIMRAIDLTRLDFGAAATFPAFPTIALLPSPGLAWYEDATSQLAPPAPAS
jgi:choloylglycine hydrolase